MYFLLVTLLCCFALHKFSLGMSVLPPKDMVVR